MICQKEGLDVQPNVIEELVSSTQADLRQILSILSTYRLTNNKLSYDQTKQMMRGAGKDFELGPFSACPNLLGSSFDRMSMADRLDQYFVDGSLMPLMIHENYLGAKANTPRILRGHDKPSFMDLTAAAAEAISGADRVESIIRGSNQEWSLAPFHGFMSCVMPAYYVHGHMQGRLEFAGWLGQNSKTGKANRLLGELEKHSYLATGCNRLSWRLDYAPALADRLISAVKTDQIDAAIGLLDSYYLTKDDFDSLLELMLDPNLSTAAYAKSVPTATKSAFTRRYNAQTHKLPYSLDEAPVSRKINFEPTVDEEAQDAIADEEEEEASEDLSKDKMIKKRNPTAVSKRGGRGGKK